MNSSVPSVRRSLMRFALRPVSAMVVVSLSSVSALSFGHAASLGGVDSHQLASFQFDGTIPPPAPTTTTTTIPPLPTGICGVGAPNLPCVVPAGTTIKKLDWDSDVVILGTVDKNLKVDGGSITIGPGGVVGGNMTQSGAGGIVIAAGGTSEGQVRESGDGSVVIDGTVDKKVDEEDGGDLVIGPNGVVGLHARESGPGDLVVSGVVDGNATESGDGSITISGTVGGDVEELDAGNLTVTATGVVRGFATEWGLGFVLIDGLVDGRVTELNDGDLTVGAVARINNGVESTPAGACTIAPTATVVGPRLGDCA